MSTLRWIVERTMGRCSAQAPAHFLHIGKTGGTAVKAALSGLQDAGRYAIHLHGHRVQLRDVPPGERVFFLLRDPVARFVSGFNSRLRQGYPRYRSPWNRAEREAFAVFGSPHALGLALASGDRSRRLAAERAMRSIRHVNASQRSWIGDEATLRERHDDLIFVGRTERLDEDFGTLRRHLGLTPTAALPHDDLAAHRAPRTVDRYLSPEAEQALRRWYSRDEELLSLCEELGLLNRVLPPA